SGAGAADGRGLRRHVLDGVLDRRVLPQLHILRLIASGDEEGFRVADGVDDEPVEGSFALLEDDGRDRIAAAEPEDVGVVVVRSRGADHDEVASARARSHGDEVLVDVRAAALKDEKPARGSHYVGGIPGEKVLITRRGGEGRRRQEKGEKNPRWRAY